MVVIPPTSVAKPIGMSIFDEEDLLRRQTLIRIGTKSTTMGVLLTKADRQAPVINVANNDSAGDFSPQDAQAPADGF